MVDPTATPTVLHSGASLLGALVVFYGPDLGPWIAVLIASSVGSFWTVGLMKTSTRFVAFLLWIRTILTACILTGALVVLMGSYINTSVDYLLPITAFCLGALGDKFESLRVVLTNRLSSWFGGQNQ